MFCIFKFIYFKKNYFEETIQSHRNLEGPSNLVKLKVKYITWYLSIQIDLKKEEVCMNLNYIN